MKKAHLAPLLQVIRQDVANYKLCAASANIIGNTPGAESSAVTSYSTGSTENWF